MQTFKVNSTAERKVYEIQLKRQMRFRRVKFLNDEVEASKKKLRDEEDKSQKEMDDLRRQLLN